MNTPAIGLTPVFTFTPHGMEQYIRDVALYRVGTEGGLINVIPRGGLELVFQRGNAGYQKLNSATTEWRVRPDVFVGGLQAAAFQVRLSPGSYLSISFHPGGSRYFIPGSQAAFSNQAVDAASIFSLRLSRLTDLLMDSLSYHQLVSAVTATLKGLYICRQASRVELGLREVARTSGRVTIFELELLSGLRASQFRHKFREEVGISPKQYLGIARTQSILRYLAEPTQLESKLTDLSYRYSYYDQAHLIREFRKHTGFTPGRIKSLFGSGHLDIDALRF